jgi:alpha-glucosidase (family GH31 glycosyl hydrolase)
MATIRHVAERADVAPSTVSYLLSDSRKISEDTRRAVRAVIDELARGAGDAVLFAHSATAGGEQFPVHWGGDCESTFGAMAESLCGGLSLGLSGFGF